MREFIEQLQEWHEAKVAVLNKIVDCEVDEIRFGEDGPVFKDPRQIAAFKTGIVAALSHLGELPFTVEEDGDAAS